MGAPRVFDSSVRFGTPAKKSIGNIFGSPPPRDNNPPAAIRRSGLQGKISSAFRGSRGGSRSATQTMATEYQQVSDVQYQPAYEAQQTNAHPILQHAPVRNASERMPARSILVQPAADRQNAYRQSDNAVRPHVIYKTQAPTDTRTADYREERGGNMNVENVIPASHTSTQGHQFETNSFSPGQFEQGRRFSSPTARQIPDAPSFQPGNTSSAGLKDRVNSSVRKFSRPMKPTRSSNSILRSERSWQDEVVDDAAESGQIPNDLRTDVQESQGSGSKSTGSDLLDEFDSLIQDDDGMDVDDSDLGLDDDDLGLDDDLDDLDDLGDDDEEDVARPPSKTCEEYRSELLNDSITDIALDISPPGHQAVAGGFGLARSWTDQNGNVLASGSIVDIRRGYLIVDSGGGRVKIPYARLSDQDWAAVSEYWRVPTECSIGRGQYVARSWVPQTFTWTASSLCHKPLYFENVPLERYGHSAGPFLQPVESTVHFFSSLFFVPYNTALNPPNECQYALGYYRPGNCAPWLRSPIPISLDGAKRQAEVVIGLSAIIP